MRCGLAAAIADHLGSAHQRTARPGEINYAFVDPYSLLHAAVGAIFALLGLRLGWVLAIAVGFSLVGIVAFGSLAGSMLPFLLKRIGFDPASASAPFVATLVDVTGLVIYFSVAFLVLHGTLL